MKKVVGIFMTIVMIFLIGSMAFGEEGLEEILDFCKANKECLRNYIVDVEKRELPDCYNIIGDTAYTVSSIGLMYEDMYDFMDNYRLYLEENWPDFANDVKIEFTYVGATENYTLVCVWLKLDNGKLMSDYINAEPAVTEITAIVACVKK